MAIPITRFNRAFTPIPEGTYVFKITDVDYDSDFDKLTLTLKTKEGRKHTERYSFATNTGETNEGALNAFSYLAANAMKDWDMDEVDEHELVGKFIEADVIHNESSTINRKTGKPFININLSQIRESDGWEDTVEPEPESELDADDIDLDDFFNS